MCLKADNARIFIESLTRCSGYLFILVNWPLTAVTFYRSCDTEGLMFCHVSGDK